MYSLHAFDRHPGSYVKLDERVSTADRVLGFHERRGIRSELDALYDPFFVDRDGSGLDPNAAAQRGGAARCTHDIRVRFHHPQPTMGRHRFLLYVVGVYMTQPCGPVQPSSERAA